MQSESGVNARQQRFVEEYLVDLNATQAAIRAGYNPKNADVTGPRMLGNVGVALAIAEKQSERADAVEVTQEYVLTNLVEILERTMQRAPVMYFDKDTKTYKQETDNEGRHVWAFDAKNALGAVGLLGKHRGMFGDKLQIEDVRDVAKLSDEELEQRRRKLRLMA